MKLKFSCFVLFILFTGAMLQAQYKFTDEIKLPATSVKNQGKTGTCWSFATTSFLESELIRMGKGPMNLSEMYSVRMIYSDKARNYILRQGTANFSEGSLAHDVFRIIDLFGMLPQDAYPGLSESDTGFDHKELSYVLKGFLDGVLEAGNPGKHWEEAFNGILDCYIGKLPESFNRDGKNHDPRSFADDIGIVTDDYISITSFSHHPYNEFFILEIPDNYSNGSFLNLELDAMVEIIDHAL
ncbi:MAG: aminopeptidase, partial [Bacteroidales bacterium]|nr:aminopeptidase [Bacteroidales bacterium]